MRRNLTVLVVGSGAREHALCWGISKSPCVQRVLCTPGNGGIGVGSRWDVKATDIAGIVRLAKEEAVGLVVVGPEMPLVAGIVDALYRADIPTFGPTALAARLEGSKIYAKTRCRQWDIPTADFDFAGSYEVARQIIKERGFRVVKADGLCGGKGVVVADTEEEALDAADDMLVKNVHGEAGSKIVVEDRLVGRECSVMAFCDGENSVLLPPARDYKRAFDGDKGPNTGGMGAYSPLPDVDEALLADIKSRIIEPTLRGMAKRGTPYHGLLYAGLMLTENGPYLLEFNVRFGDPETQVVLPRIDSDIVEYMLATLEPGGLAKLPPLEISSDAAVCTNTVSEGYPDTYRTGFPITNLERARLSARLFHAGTEWNRGLVTSGGRVISCVATNPSLDEAREYSRCAAETLRFENKFFRTDIAANV